MCSENQICAQGWSSYEQCWARYLLKVINYKYFQSKSLSKMNKNASIYLLKNYYYNNKILKKCFFFKNKLTAQQTLYLY